MSVFLSVCPSRYDARHRKPGPDPGTHLGDSVSMLSHAKYGMKSGDTQTLFSLKGILHETKSFGFGQFRTKALAVTFSWGLYVD